MAVDYTKEQYAGNITFLPKIGEEATFDIIEINEVPGENPKFNFSQDVAVMVNGQPLMDDEGKPIMKKKDLGYHIECRLASGKVLTINSMSAFKAVFKYHQIQDGQKVIIRHKAKGEWEVEKL